MSLAGQENTGNNRLTPSKLQEIISSSDIKKGWYVFPKPRVIEKCDICGKKHPSGKMIQYNEHVYEIGSEHYKAKEEEKKEIKQQEEQKKGWGMGVYASMIKKLGK